MADNWDDLSPQPLNQQESPNWDSLSQTPSQNPSWEDLNESPPDQQQEKYGTTGQQIGAGIEGIAQGIAGPVAPWLEKQAGIPEEDITGRAAANPIAHGLGEAAGLVGGTLTGVGEGALAAGIGERLAPEAVTMLGKAGSAFIKNAIGASVIQSGDEISHAILGQGDPQEPVAAALTNIAGAALLGGATGGIFNLMGQGASKGIQSVANAELREKVGNGLVGLGIANELKNIGIDPAVANDRPELVQDLINKMNLGGENGLTLKDVKPGINAYNSIHQAVSGKVGSFVIGAGSTALSHMIGAGDIGSTAIGAAGSYSLTPIIDNLVGKGIGMTGKYVGPAILKSIADGNIEGLGTIGQYGKAISKGSKQLDKTVDSLFMSGPAVLNPPDESKNKKLKDTIQKGGVTQQLQNQQEQNNQTPQFAEGGVVKPDVSTEPDHLATAFPEQNALLNTAKGRVYNYLNSLRPQDIPPTLPFDTQRPKHEHDRTYDRAINIANSPLHIIDKIKDGSITPEHIKHLTQMYPEIYNALSKRIMKKIVKNQMDGEKPNYKIRQGLSMFLASPLESTFTPTNIQAAQAVFAPQQSPAQQAQPGKTKKGTSKLGKSNSSYRTPEQAAEEANSERD